MQTPASSGGTGPPAGARPAPAPRPSQPPAQQGRGGPRPQQQGARPPAQGGQQAQQAMRMMPPGAAPGARPLCVWRLTPPGARCPAQACRATSNPTQVTCARACLSPPPRANPGRVCLRSSSPGDAGDAAAGRHVQPPSGRLHAGAPVRVPRPWDRHPGCAVFSCLQSSRLRPCFCGGI